MHFIRKEYCRVHVGTKRFLTILKWLGKESVRLFVVNKWNNSVNFHLIESAFSQFDRRHFLTTLTQGGRTVPEDVITSRGGKWRTNAILDPTSNYEVRVLSVSSDSLRHHGVVRFAGLRPSRVNPENTVWCRRRKLYRTQYRNVIVLEIS